MSGPLFGAALAIAGCTALVSTSGLDEGDEAPLTQAPGHSDGAAESGGASDAEQSDVEPSDAGTEAEASVVDPSLIGAWTFDEPSGPVSADVSGHGREALIFDGAQLSPGGGVRGGAVVFDGTGRVDVEELNGAAFPSSGTLSIWLKRAVVQGTSTERSVLDGWDNLRTHLWLRFPNGADSPPASLQVGLQRKGETRYVWAAGTDVAEDTWTHVVLTWSSTNERGAFYVDGVLLARSAYAADAGGFVPTEQTFRLGSRFVGALDEVRLYDRELSAGEAAAIP